jgi:hypothetical protein
MLTTTTKVTIRKVQFFLIVYEKRCHLPDLKFYLLQDYHRLLRKLDTAID